MNKKIDSILEDKSVEVKPITRGGAYLPENHDGASLFSGAKWSVNLPIDKARNQFVEILNKEEQELFEKELNKKPGELSFYERSNPFWRNFTVTLTKEGIKLNLKDPIDNLKWRVLKANSDKIAPSWDKRHEDARFKFALVEQGYQNTEILKKNDKIKRAFIHYGKIEDDVKKLKSILTIYGKKISETADIDFLRAEVNKIIDTDVDGFLLIADDKDFSDKLLIAEAVKSGALLRAGKNGYKLPGTEDNETIADNTKEMVEWVKDPNNQPKVLVMKARISQAND